MIVTLAHKIKLNPTNEQKAYFRKSCAASRKVWNWALSEYNKNNNQKITGKGNTLKARFTKLKKTDEWQWTNEVSTYATQQPFIDLQKAISRYFKLKKEGNLKPPKNWRGRKDKKPFGWPRFKSWRHSKSSFYESNNGLKFNDHNVSLPKIGWVNMSERLRFEGRVLGARISFDSGLWWISVQVQTEIEPLKSNNNNIIGIDMGIKYLAKTSNGNEYHNPKALYKYQDKLAKLQQKLDRQLRATNPDCYDKNGVGIKGKKPTLSNRAKKTKTQIQAINRKIANIRRDASHKMTTEITQNNGIICIEDLNIKGMMQNGRLAKAISDAALYEKRRQLEYKAALNGGIIIAVDRWFPSSKMCNVCGLINADLQLSDRFWECKECETIHDRDENAAINIKNEGMKKVMGLPNSDYNGQETVNLYA